MRELLEAFRLPGEAQPIGRITETFAEHFFSYKPGTRASPLSSIDRIEHSLFPVNLLDAIKSQDATYVLAYSVIMLNTDQHNPQNRVSLFFFSLR